MLIYVRHGETDLNGTGADERLRGWLPVPLTKKGEAQAHDAAANIPLQPDTFESSDLLRAAQTAQIIGEHLGTPPVANPAIRDWNTGDLAGQPVKAMLPTIHHLIDNSSVPAPGGESFQSYIDRFVPLMKQKVADPGIHLVTGHARGASVLEGIASPVGEVGGDVDPALVKEKPRLKPGGVMLISPQWQTKVINPNGR